ncbi:starp antigen [Schistosoma japonicum]|nr:starp antigen [Schistosoma japonicum]KAH8870752.1 starp antigen [Schistosoma japonicum]KAH8870753.1 starp antigen [Schistosoma japonicum]
MSCAQITVQEYILTKPYSSSMNNISTDNSSCSRIVFPDVLENSAREEQTSVKPLPESNDVSQCKCIQSPCECYLMSKIETSSVDYISPTDLDSNFGESRNKDNFTAITLADYFDVLKKQSNERTPHSILPREIINHYQMSRNKSASSVFTSSKQQLNVNHDELANEQINDNKISTNSSGTSNNDGCTESSFPLDYYNYLKKRRIFLTDRLLSRYHELIKLLNEELELTGHPPANYLQHTHAYHEALEAFKKIHGNDVPNADYDVITNNESCFQMRIKGPNPKSINFIPVRGSRLQETGFMLSPRVMRRASIKLSSSVNCLLKSSHSSLFTEDLSNQNREQSLHTDGDSSSQILESSSNSSHLVKDHKHDTISSTASASKKLTKDNSIIQKLNKSIPSAFKSRFTFNLMKSTYDLSTSASSPSLCDSGIFLRQTTKTTPSTTLPESLATNTTAHSSSSPRSSVSTGLANITQPVSNQSNKIITVNNHKQDVYNPYSGKDIQQAISWLEVELNAVKNIMLANMKCADENKRNRASRKAYRLAVKHNQETITNLEDQIRGLQMYAEKQKLLKCSISEDTSICNQSGHQSLLRISSSISLSSPSYTCSSPSSSLTSSERKSISSRSINVIPSRMNILRKCTEKFKHSSTNNFNTQSNSRPIVLYSNNRTDLSLQHNQLNENVETCKQLLPNVKVELSKGNEIQDNSSVIQQTVIPLKEITTITMNYSNDGNDIYENGSEIYYEHQRDNDYSITTASSVPCFMIDGKESQLDKKMDSTTSEGFNSNGTQTVDNEILQNTNNGLNSNSTNSQLLSDDNYVKDTYSWKISQSRGMSSFQNSSPYYQFSSDLSNKPNYDNHQNLRHDQLSFNKIENYLPENKCQLTSKPLNEFQNSLLPMTKPYLHPTLSSSSRSTANSLCSINLIGQCESTPNTGACYVIPVNKALQSSYSVHNIRSTPQRTLIDVDLNNHCPKSDYPLQKNGIKTPTSQSTYHLSTHQHQNTIDGRTNNPNLQYLPREKVRSPVFINKASKGFYYSPISQNQLRQSTQKVIDCPTVLYPGLTRYNKELRVTSSTVNLCQSCRDSPSRRPTSNHSPRVIERVQSKTTLNNYYFGPENMVSRDCSLSTIQ